MNQNRIIRLSAAKRDLNEIWLHIARENSETVADAVLARIDGALEVLAAAPLIGRLRTDLRGNPRSFPVLPYLIVYTPWPKTNGIVVWRILHGARDVSRIVTRPKSTRKTR
jgi:plasmid stabilization system protein ParE